MEKQAYANVDWNERSLGASVSAKMSSPSNTLCKPDKRPEIDQSLNDLSNQIGYLQEGIQQLASMLDPVLSMPTPQTEPISPQQEYQSSLAQTISDQRYRIKNLISATNNLINRIEL